MIVDLHSHSTASDGTLTPTALLDHAKQHGVNMLALTDHDEIAGLAAANQIATRHGIRLINGVEISVTWRGRTLHVLGLGIDPQHPDLVAGLKTLRDSRKDRAIRIADALSRHGIPDSLEGAQRYATERVLSRTHFARFLVESGRAKDMKTVFKKFLVRGKPGYTPHTWAPLEQAVGWIRASGGDAVIAHPGRYGLGCTLLDALFDEFKALGGAGLEVISGSHTAEHATRFAAYCARFEFVASAGSDYHGPENAYLDLGRLPPLPPGCVPIWSRWLKTA